MTEIIHEEIDPDGTRHTFTADRDAKVTVKVEEAPPIRVMKRTVAVPLSDEQREDLASMPSFMELMERAAEAQRKFDALPAEEQQRILAEREAQREAEKAARTCEHCGCDPDEHGGY